jgi:hypothetical protein
MTLAHGVAKGLKETIAGQSEKLTDFVLEDE